MRFVQPFRLSCFCLLAALAPHGAGAASAAPGRGAVVTAARAVAAPRAVSQGQTTWRGRAAIRQGISLGARRAVGVGSAAAPFYAGIYGQGRGATPFYAGVYGDRVNNRGHFANGQFAPLYDGFYGSGVAVIGPDREPPAVLYPGLPGLPVVLGIADAPVAAPQITVVNAGQGSARSNVTRPRSSRGPALHGAQGSDVSANEAGFRGPRVIRVTVPQG